MFARACPRRGADIVSVLMRRDKSIVTNPLRDLFAGLAPSYERVNHALTLGLDVLARSAARTAGRAAKRSALERRRSRPASDCGAGRRARARSRGSLPPDPCRSPEARVAAQAVLEGPFEFVLADVKSLPFPGGIFDLITISFATRNIHLSRRVLTETFGEFRRVSDRTDASSTSKRASRASARSAFSSGPTFGRSFFPSAGACPDRKPAMPISLPPSRNFIRPKSWPRF